ncbi:hypothetical protein L208DRAFT_1377197 [Tricholoma matsutake]|nr:hypothetical protein L208DRAFT_1377197 [Tricholoma matsutake 945]
MKEDSGKVEGSGMEKKWRKVARKTKDKDDNEDEMEIEDKLDTDAERERDCKELAHDMDLASRTASFFGKLKTVQFHSNKVLELYLELVYDRYAEIQTCLEDMEDQSVHPPIQQVQKMSISYLTEMNDEDRQSFALLPRSDSLPALTALVAQKCLRKRRLSKASIRSPPHAKLRLTDQPVTDAAELPTMSSVQTKGLGSDPGSPTAHDVR